VHLGDLIDFVGNLLDYDPTNTTYREQLVSILNDAQTHILTDRPWPFAMKDRKLKVWTDDTFTFNFVNGSNQITGVLIPVSTDMVLPGGEYALATIESESPRFRHRIMWVKNGTTAFLDRPFEGLSGTYQVTIKRREIRLPSDAMTVQNVGDPSVGIPAKALFLSKWEREDANLDPDLLGVIEAYLPSQAFVVAAPRTPRGVTVETVAAGQGVRTINVFMVNVRAPNATNYQMYPRDVSDGFESALSKVQTYSLTDTQTLYFQPEPLNPQTGYYRRYYFTCPEAGILAPVRIRHTEPLEPTGVSTGTDTVPPDNPAFGGIQLRPRLELNYLSTQAFQASSIRYRWNQTAAYQQIMLYPHPSADQDLNVRMVINPPRLQEDQDAPLVPHAYAQLIAFAALENLTLKVDNPALAQVYQRKKETLYKAMEQAYLKATPRRIIKGNPTAGYRYVKNPFGPLTFT
jgi:hypothetical protein